MNNESFQNNFIEDQKKEDISNNVEDIDKSKESLEEESTVESNEDAEIFAKEKIDSLNKEAEESMGISEPEENTIVNLDGDPKELENEIKLIDNEKKNIIDRAKKSIQELVEKGLKKLSIITKKTVEHPNEIKEESQINEDILNIDNENKEIKDDVSKVVTENTSEEVEGIESKIDKIIGTETTFGGKFEYNVIRESLEIIDEIGYAKFKNPKNDLVDAYIAAFSDVDYLGYMRVYKNGEPTNRFTSKLKRETKKDGVTKKMIEELQKMLPEEHEYAEDTSISLDGFKWFIKQLSQGYEVLKDENGNIITTEIALNGAAKENPFSELGTSEFGDLRLVKFKDMKIVEGVISENLKKLGAQNLEVTFGTKNDNYITAIFNLPVLVKKPKR